MDLTRPIAQRHLRPFAAPCFALALLSMLAFVPATAHAAPDEDATPKGESAAAQSTESSPTGGEAAGVQTAPAESVTAEGAEAARSHTLTRELAEQGESELNKAVRVFQQRYLVKRHRLELQLGGGMTINDDMVTHYAADAGLFFHFTDQFAFGITASKYAARDTSAAAAVENNFGLFAERSHLQAGGMAEVQWAPLFGKFAVFGLGVVQVDAFLLAGGGVERTTRGTDLKPAGEIGAGVRLHLLRWLSLSADIRDIIYQEKFLDCDPTSYSGVCSTVTMNQWFTGMRIGIFIPPTFTYRFPR